MSLRERAQQLWTLLVLVGAVAAAALSLSRGGGFFRESSDLATDKDMAHEFRGLPASGNRLIP